MDNYLVRVLAGKSAWELPPGGVGAAELTVSEVCLFGLLAFGAHKLKMGFSYDVIQKSDSLATFQTGAWVGTMWYEAAKVSLLWRQGVMRAARCF